MTANGVLICNAVLRNSATTAQNKRRKSVEEAEANALVLAAAPDPAIGADRDALGVLQPRFAEDAVEEHLGALQRQGGGAARRKAVRDHGPEPPSRRPDGLSNR